MTPASFVSDAVGAIDGATYEISYGKRGVAAYRHDAQPLTGIRRVAESPFVGRPNTVFANAISVEVLGENFLPAYTLADNSLVVATDSIKNFILARAGDYPGATLEGYLAHVGEGLLARYPQIPCLRVAGRELPFIPASIPLHGGFGPSDVLHQRQLADHAAAELRYERSGESSALTGHRCGRRNIELLKTRGSAFTRFVRDEYTTLPERGDRPLFIDLDVHWIYSDASRAVAIADYSEYVPGEQVRDVCASVFAELVSESIQNLLHEMARCLLERYPQVATFELGARNMTHDPHQTASNETGADVFVDPFPAQGTITLSVTRGQR